MADGFAIRTVDLRKSYGGTVAVDGVSLEVRTGEFYGILGPNGAVVGALAGVLFRRANG